jgi:asparagine synthase (glutamine-hydrolysing)
VSFLDSGPAHTSGFTPFKNINEIKPAHFLIFNEDGMHFERYWKLNSKEHKDSFGKTCENIRFLLEDSISKQIELNAPICTMLSGGLDSSIITAYVSNLYKNNKMGSLSTYSVDYVDNDINFVKSDFQPNSDNYYIDLRGKKYNTNHHKIIIDTPELESALEDALIAREIPGMADVDSSLLLFCRNIFKDVKIAISR